MAVGVKTRTGARSFLNVMQKACKWSRFPGFRGGLNSILGPETATQIMALWEPLCSAIDVIVGLDDWYNQKDNTDTDGPGEDTGIPS